MNLKSKKEQQMSDHIENLQTKFSSLAPMSDTVSEFIQVAISIESLCNVRGYEAITDSIGKKKSGRGHFDLCVN